MPIILGKEGKEKNTETVHSSLPCIVSIEQVKTRMLEYLSVLKVKKDAKAPIICFVGPVSL